MKMGFLISHKNNEERRALLPDVISDIKEQVNDSIKNKK